MSIDVQLKQNIPTSKNNPKKQIKSNFNTSINQSNPNSNINVKL